MGQAGSIHQRYLLEGAADRLHPSAELGVDPKGPRIGFVRFIGTHAAYDRIDAETI